MVAETRTERSVLSQSILKDSSRERSENKRARIHPIDDF